MEHSLSLKQIWFLSALVICMTFVFILDIFITSTKKQTAPGYSEYARDVDSWRIPVAYDVLELCEQICDRNNESCFAPNSIIVIYENTSLEQMTFRQRFSPLVQRENKNQLIDDVHKGKFERRKLCPLQDISSAYSTIHKSGTCAIIGNGGIILGSHCGKHIDSNDLVIRANFAKIEGYDIDVGNRTSIMMINDASLTNIHNSLIKKKSESGAKQMVDYISRHLNDSIIWFAKSTEAHDSHNRLHKIGEYFRGNHIQAKLGYSLVETSQAVRKRWNFRNYPSSGLEILAVAETFCQNITLYGFYPYDKAPDGRTVLHHYYDPGLVNFTTKNHNFDKEHKLLKSMHEKGILKLVYGTCV